MGPQAIIYNKLFEFDYEKKPFLMGSEMDELRKHFDRLEEGQENLVSKMDLMEDSIKELKSAIVGNPPMNTKGLAEQIKDLEDRMREYDRKGVIASTDKVHVLEEKVRGYDKLLDRGWGATKAVAAIWVLLGGFIGYITTLVLKKFGL
jgi:hypothetical protein